ncbi:hypothetical protein SFRURICE_010258 [Spodoptera frugiperda]|uniref:SFRICE_012448 n=1 Tax=Spodoptera frugiperda TaxID=7108 RepID=A0A2H1V1Z2_SPOFR|nr:hypothetical protein SFRURICE_010258 [Spodoptera frugiperda]
MFSLESRSLQNNNRDVATYYYVDDDLEATCVLWMCAMDGFPTIDTSDTRVAHLLRTATLRRRVFIAHLTRTATQFSISGKCHIVSQLSYYIFVV